MLLDDIWIRAVSWGFSLYLLYICNKNYLKRHGYIFVKLHSKITFEKGLTLFTFSLFILYFSGGNRVKQKTTLHSGRNVFNITSFQIRSLSFFFLWKTWTRHGFWRETKKMTQQFVQFGIYLKPRWLTKEASLVTLLPWTVQNSQTSLYTVLTYFNVTMQKFVVFCSTTS